MFKIFISASSLERLCLEEMSKEQEQRSSWFLLLSKQNIIYLDKNIYDEWEYGDALFTFSESFQINFKPSNVNYNTLAKESPHSLLVEPQGAFLLDVDKDTAKSIQDNYGIICQSTDSLNECLLSSNECKFTLFKDTNVHSWKELFEKGAKVPSNALIIIDRYIFGWEGNLMSNYGDGVENIKQIMKAVLPASLSCDYHVLILFDASSSKDRNFELGKVAQQLESFKTNVLKRPYNVILELYSVTNKCANYDETHNRKIISNYFIGSAEHLLKAFKRDGNAICNQDIRVECAYSHGLVDYSDSAISSINHLLKQFHNMHEKGIDEYDNATENASEYIVMCGTNTSSTVHDIKNRLILQK